MAGGISDHSSYLLKSRCKGSSKLVVVDCLVSRPPEGTTSFQSARFAWPGAPDCFSEVPGVHDPYAMRQRDKNKKPHPSESL
jgi:hypothetical protein